MHISVVIPTFNRRELVRLSLSYMAAQCLSGDITVDVIVVDDGSNDGTDTMIREVGLEYPHSLKYVFRPRDTQSCRGRARNLGVAVAEGDYVLFMDSGVVIPPNFIVQLDRVLTIETQRPVLLHRVVGLDLDLAQFDATLLDALTPDSLQESIDAFEATEGWADRREALFASAGNQLNQLPAPWALAWSCLLTVPKGLIDAVGGFDETFLEWGAEDIDLGYRLHLAGAQFFSPPELRGLHIPHARDTDHESQFLSNQRNELKMHAKHHHLATEVYVTYAGLYFNQILGRLQHMVCTDVLPTYPYALAARISRAYLVEEGRNLLVGDDHLARLAHWQVSHQWVVNPRLGQSIAERFPERTIRLQLGTHTPYANGWFDTVILTDFLRLFGDAFVEAIMGECVRIAKRCLVLFTEDFLSPAKRRDGAGQWHTRADLDRLAVGLGCEFSEQDVWDRYRLLVLRKSSG